MEYDIYKGYTVIDGFGFASCTYQGNIHDAIIIKCAGVSDCEAPQYDVPYHTIEEYIDFINTNRIQKALIILDSISFLPMCPTLQFISVIPSYQAAEKFDFSPLYQMPEIKSLDCQTIYGDREQYMGEIDYTRINGLISLGISVNKGTLNYNQVETLKTLDVSGFKGKNRDLTDLFCSEELDTLRMIQCGIQSLDGIEISHKMERLYLHYNRSLSDISALSRVKGTLKRLEIENSSKITDFSVLGELDQLEILELSGSNTLPNLDFLKTMKNLKWLLLGMNVLDGNLEPCLKIPRVDLHQNRKHYNLKDSELPKGKYVLSKTDIEEWRRI